MKQDGRNFVPKETDSDGNKHSKHLVKSHKAPLGIHNTPSGRTIQEIQMSATEPFWNPHGTGLRPGGTSHKSRRRKRG